MKISFICAIFAIAFVTFSINTNTYADNTGALFNDFSAGHWAYDSVQNLYNRQIISGDSDGNFRPNDYVTNAEAAKIFSVALGLGENSTYESVYGDVYADSWYCSYANMTDGLFLDVFDSTGKKIFSPDHHMTREEMFYSVVNMTGIFNENIRSDLSLRFSDVSDFNPIYLPYGESILAKGIVNGYDDGTVRPKANITRAEFSTLIAKILPMLNGFNVDINDGKVVVVKPYANIGKALKIILGKKGPNSIFDFNSVSMMTKYAEEYIPTDYYQFDTDLISPYIVRAINNADGDLQYSADFTGGNHCYNNTGYGSSATGRTDTLSYSVDGVEGTVYSGAAQSVMIKYRNYIQATNTKKLDGSGREVLTEDIEISCNGDEWIVENTVTALEDIVIERYYGLQFPAKGIFNRVQYGDEYSELTVHSLDYESDSNNICDTVLLYGNIFNLKINIDIESLKETINFNNKVYTVFTTDYGKTYFNIINTDNPLELKAGESFKIKGSYKFFG